MYITRLHRLIPFSKWVAAALETTTQLIKCENESTSVRAVKALKHW